MFSGIVASIGNVESVLLSEKNDMCVRIGVSNSELLLRVPVGGSISCAGVCLTVVEKGETYFVTNISNATLDVTNLKFWSPGTKVNLEPSLRVGDRIDGHLVQGHIDCVGRIVSLAPIAGSHTMEISCDTAIKKYIARKGSVALEGVSLTVNHTEPGLFRVNLIPYTWNNTTFQYNKVGDNVNIETDLIARHVEALMMAYSTPEE